MKQWWCDDLIILVFSIYRTVEKEEMREWETHHARDRKKKKEKEEGGKEKEEREKLVSFFGAIYKLFNPVPVPVPVNDFVPVALPARFVPVAFGPAASASFPHHCMTTSSSA